MAKRRSDELLDLQTILFTCKAGWVNTATIAKALDISPGQARRCLPAYVDAGLIEARQLVDAQGSPWEYRQVPGKVAAMASSA